jgi:hypothetical protein
MPNTEQAARQCHFCPAALHGAGTINGAHWTGTEYVRVDLCSECFAAGKLASAPRRPRQPRRAPVYAATDWNMLVAFSKR